MWGLSSLSHTPLQLGASYSSKMLPEIEMGWQEGRGSGRMRRKGDYQGGREKSDWMLGIGRPGVPWGHQIA